MKLKYAAFLLSAGLLGLAGEAQAVEMASAGCATPGTAVEKVAATLDEATGDITVDVHLCEATNPDDNQDRSVYRVFFDYAAPFLMDTDRNADKKRDFKDFCTSTHEVVMERNARRKDSNKFGRITPAEDQAASILSFQVNLDELEIPASTTQIYIWTDIARTRAGGGAAARFPGRERGDDCPEFGWKAALGLSIAR